MARVSLDAVQDVSRRQIFRLAAGAGALVGAFTLGVRGARAQQPGPFPISAPVVMGQYSLPPLEYGYDALEPFIDTLTMQLHHTNHHQAAVNQLNMLSQRVMLNPDIETVLMNLMSVPEDVRMAVRNNGGSHYNHMIFWAIMGPNRGGEPTGEIGAAIRDRFGSFAQFREQMNAAGTGRFGSGWAWLTMDQRGELRVESTPNQDNPIMEGRFPIMGVDVWEHSYYLRYYNGRAAYLNAWWNTVNWTAVNNRLFLARTRMTMLRRVSEIMSAR